MLVVVRDTGRFPLHDAAMAVTIVDDLLLVGRCKYSCFVWVCGLLTILV